MALQTGRLAVYVAFNCVILALFSFTSTAWARGSPNVMSLLQPYDFLYYSGVRAYFSGEWGKAAELLEKSIVTRESLFRVRRQCYDDCMAAGTEALKKLGKLGGNINYTRYSITGNMIICLNNAPEWCSRSSLIVSNMLITLNCINKLAGIDQFCPC